MRQISLRCLSLLRSLLLVGAHRIENLYHCAMTSLGFDIFRKMEDGHPLWIAEVAVLKEAKAQLHALALKAPGEYFIRDASNGRIIFEFVSPP